VELVLLVRPAVPLWSTVLLVGALLVSAGPSLAASPLSTGPGHESGLPGVWAVSASAPVHDRTGPSHAPFPAPGTGGSIYSKAVSSRHASPHGTTPAAEGVEYSGASAIASSVGVEVRVPDDLPSATDLYYVALSVFDGAESYDQVGLANDNGSWQVYYGAATACDTRPDAHWDAFSLDRNVTYRFEISIQTGGEVIFGAFDPSGSSLWQETVHTGATYFELDSTTVCGSATDPGYTETQEVYTAALSSPPYNFVLTNATENGLPESEWLGLPGSVDPSATVRNGSNVTIFNQPFTISFGAPGDRVSLEATNQPQSLGVAVSVDVEGLTTTPIEVQNYTEPSGWRFSANPGQASASFQSKVTLLIPPDVSPGVYVVGIQAVNASGLPNRIALVLTVLNRLVLTVVSTPLSGSIDANETATFDPNASGGLPNYTYRWTLPPTGCVVVATEATCRFTAPGTYSLEADVTDALQYAGYQNESYTVRPDPQLAISTPSFDLGLGSGLNVSVALTGGLEPFQIYWQGLPPGCPPVNGTDLTCTPHQAGHYSVTLTVTDSTGFRTSLSLSVGVATSPSGSTVPLEALGLDFVAAGILVLIAACALLLVRRNRAP
jgi:hypothetical protein